MLLKGNPSKVYLAIVKVLLKIRAECPEIRCAECKFYNDDHRECMFGIAPAMWTIPREFWESISTNLRQKIEPKGPK